MCDSTATHLKQMFGCQNADHNIITSNEVGIRYLYFAVDQYKRRSRIDDSVKSFFIITNWRDH